MKRSIASAAREVRWPRVSSVVAAVVAVSSSPDHSFSKQNRSVIRVVAGVGVEGDAHAGQAVKHRYLVRTDRTQPNLRQVHLIHAELFDDLAGKGYTVGPGDLGENITTRGVDLLGLPTGSFLEIGDRAVVEVTGLRNPCAQIDEYQSGLMRLLRFRDSGGAIRRIGGVMAVVVVGGAVEPGDEIAIDRPPEPHVPLVYVANSHEPAVPLRSHSS